MVPYMNLFPGNAKNLVPDNARLLTVKKVYVNWYATFDGDLGWSTDVIA